MTMSHVDALIDEFTGIVGEGFVRTTPQVESYRLDGHVPWALVSPGYLEEIAAVLAVAHREQLAVVPWGGGTTMSLGRPLDRMDIALCLHRLNHVLDHEPADLTATAQAGITLTDLQNQLGSRGQWWPVDPPLPEAATLGGTLATNASGPKRYLYGTVRDLVIGVKVVHADGVLSKAGGKVAKNVTGYDMMKLYIGSLGTLAVIVEATLKLRPVPLLQQLLWATFPTSAAAWQAARRILTSPLLPNAVELLNPAVALYLHQNVAGPDKADGWALLIGVDGGEEVVARQTRDLQTICHETAMTAWWTDLDDGRLWRDLQARFRSPVSDHWPRLVLRLGCKRSQVLSFLDVLSQIGTPPADAVELTARLGNGLIYASLPCPRDPGEMASLAGQLMGVRQQLSEIGGYLVVESASAPFKEQFDIWGDPGPQAGVMSALKREFDPRRVLNPGRFVNGL
jgi:glycolate oxidase FAD binding subunit